MALTFFDANYMVFLCGRALLLVFVFFWKRSMSHLMMRYGKTGSGAYFFWVEAQSQIYGVFEWKSTHSNMGVVIPKIVVWRLLFFDANYMVFLG